MSKKKEVKKGVEPIPKQHPDDERSPVSGTFMIIAIVGFLISVTYTVSGRFNEIFSIFGPNAGYTWGFLFILFFLIMFISSVASMHSRFKYYP